jgi:hypothetical protein
MKYFTPELIERYGSANERVAGAADEEWEYALSRYENYLQRLEPSLPQHIREFTRLLLHGSIVWSIARQDDKLIMVMRKDIPPKDALILTYTLLAEPVINDEALSAEHRASVMTFQYDEFERVQDGDGQVYAQSIIFANGWEMSLRFSDVQFTLAEPVYPLGNTMLVSVPVPKAAKSA